MGAARSRVTLARAVTLDDIPDKLYFKIGEVVQLVGVEAHVLRYWEKEIPAIRPGKSASRQRRYRRRDVALFWEVRRLLYDEKYTLAGARRRLTAAGRTVSSADEAEEEILPAPPAARQLPPGGLTPERAERLRSGLLALLRLAEARPPS